MFEALFGNETASKVLESVCKSTETYAQEVARDTCSTLSLVQAQMQRLERGGVLTSRVQGRMRLYSFDPSFVLRDDLVHMFQRASAAAEQRDTFVRNALFTLGAPTFGEEVVVDGVECALVDGVALSHRDGAVASVLPVCFFKQRDHVDVEKLVREATLRGELRALGMFLDLTALLSGDERVAEWTERLRVKQLRPRLDYFFADDRRSEFSRVAAKRKTPELAKTWGYWLNTGVGTFESMFRKHAYA